MTGSAITAAADAFPAEVEDFTTWLAVEKGRAANTLDAYRRDLRRWLDHLDRRGRTVLDATPDDVIAFVHVLQGEGLAPASVTRTLVAVRGLHRFLVAEEYRPDDPAADVEVPRVPRGLPKALTVDEVTVLVESVAGDDAVARRDRAVLETLYGTGARISELVGLSLGDVDLHDGLVRVMGKGSKERIVPAGPSRRHRPGRLAESARARRDGTGSVGSSHRRGRSVPQPAGRTDQPPGDVGDRPGPGRTTWVWATA